jgi:3-oxoacyl-[acyl-carrier protein] reductase
VSVVIVGGEPTVSSGVAQQLTGQGQSVVTISDGSDPAAAYDAQHRQCDLASADALVSELEATAATLGETPALVRIGLCAAQERRADLVTIDLDQWVARAEAPIREAFAFHQAAQRFLADTGGRVIAVLPTVGLSGGRGYAPLATSAEADRSLMKAQARAIGAQGITINTVAVATALLAGVGDDPGDDPDRGGLPAYATPRPDLATVADVILALLGPAFATVTGQTIAVDGGRWMAS